MPELLSIIQIRTRAKCAAELCLRHCLRDKRSLLAQLEASESERYSLCNRRFLSQQMPFLLKISSHHNYPSSKRKDIYMSGYRQVDLSDRKTIEEGLNASKSFRALSAKLSAKRIALGLTGCEVTGKATAFRPKTLP